MRVRKQAGVDVDVACRALEMLFCPRGEPPTTVVLVAGDGDFLSVAETCRRAGAKFVVAAFLQSANPALTEFADRFVALDGGGFFGEDGGGGGGDDDDDYLREGAGLQARGAAEELAENGGTPILRNDGRPAVNSVDAHIIGRITADILDHGQGGGAEEGVVDGLGPSEAGIGGVGLSADASPK